MWTSPQRRKDAEISAENTKNGVAEGAGFTRWRRWSAERAESAALIRGGAIRYNLDIEHGKSSQSTGALPNGHMPSHRGRPGAPLAAWQVAIRTGSGGQGRQGRLVQPLAGWHRSIARHHRYEPARHEGRRSPRRPT